MTAAIIMITIFGIPPPPPVDDDPVALGASPLTFKFGIVGSPFLL
jgi:hypothetical protein